MTRQVAQGVWLLDLGLVPPFASNAYLVDDAATDVGSDDTATDGGSESSEVTLIDAGLFWNRRSIRTELAAAGYTVSDIDRVLLTHYDLDHTGGLNRIRGELSAPVHIGAVDGRLIDRDHHPSALHHKGLFHRIVRRFAPLPADVTVEHVDDGDRVGRFTAHHTPGHNPGHTVYVHDSGAAFLGDLVWEDDGELTPPVWFDSYDMSELYESIRLLADRDPEFEVACMGHGTPLSVDGREALQRLAERV